MAGESRTLAVVAILGLSPRSLGNYLASLGLLGVLARRWPSVRAAWRDGIFHIVGGVSGLDEIVAELADIAAGRGWTPYTRGWDKEQKKGTKSKSGTPLALWQACAEEGVLELFAAHAVPAARVSFNPLLGSGGNAGRRDFSKGWKRAADALMASTATKSAPDAGRKRAELKALLAGDTVTWTLKELNAACWFSNAMELSNSGQRPSREEPLSPWAMVLACEGLAFFAGGASRRLGARAHAVGAFPFVVHAAAPDTEGEAGHDRGEVWAPIWNRPMTAPEITTLFSRGRAEVGGRGALIPSAFAVAVMRRGVDAGIAEFRRFVLGQTTSANTFEPRFEAVVRVPARPATPQAVASPSLATSTALERLLALIERLPRDRKVGNRWRFVGLRGPLEAAMIGVTATPEDPEAACALLDATVRALDRIDANKGFRERETGWEALPVEWVRVLVGDEALCVEARLALALVSAFPAERPFALYRFGAELIGKRRFVHPKQSPARWVWRPGPLPHVLAEVMFRRTLDWEKDRRQGGVKEPARLMIPTSVADIELWLAGHIDESLLARWLSRLALFDWRYVPEAVRSIAGSNAKLSGMSAALCLYGVLHPLFDLRPVSRLGASPTRDLLPPESGARAPAACRRIAALLRVGETTMAIGVARSRYAMAGAPLIKSDVPWRSDDPERLLASLLIPTSDQERTALLKNWLRPLRNKLEVAYA